MFQLVNTLKNVIHCSVPQLLDWRVELLGHPSMDHFLEGAHVDAAVVEELLDFRHVFAQKAPVSMD